ncbi:hypothetical protein RvY_12589 [Ramazzottius varieornatus]|uniref:Apextrin C-terminal domain-containing protein n=1 Tax=Ramazzottius varieornatus TaxID=947166 RepID=A0A1D1VMA9_RAMVA|nr:hypothetical protein RvY_12589 [Ramazzottius varieornatus]
MFGKTVCIVLTVVALQEGHGYYTSRRCYGTGDCHLLTKNQDGGFDDASHQWLSECNDGEGVVAIRDDDTHFEGLSGIWCSFLFPMKQSTKGVYPYYPSCAVRNLTAGEYHCRGEGQNNQTQNLFVSGIYKEPDERQAFVPSLMKCCETPSEYRIDHSNCHYKKTFDRFGEHYTGEWLVKCDSHFVATGIGKDVNPWDSKEHFTWVQCCPLLYTPKAAITLLPATIKASSTQYLVSPAAENLNQVPILNDPGQVQQMSSSARADIFPALYLTASGQSPVQTTTIDGASTGQWLPKLPLPATQSLHGLQTIPEPLPLTTTTYSAPAISAIQHAANVAAYKEFIHTFNDLLANYSKAQSQKATKEPQHAPPMSYQLVQTPLQNIQPPISLNSAFQTEGGFSFVQPPLPSGIQNYMALTSNNPGAALSSLYSQPSIFSPTPVGHPEGSLVGFRQPSGQPQPQYVMGPTTVFHEGYEGRYPQQLFAFTPQHVPEYGTYGQPSGHLLVKPKVEKEQEQLDVKWETLKTGTEKPPKGLLSIVGLPVDAKSNETLSLNLTVNATKA